MSDGPGATIHDLHAEELLNPSSDNIRAVSNDKTAKRRFVGLTESDDESTCASPHSSSILSLERPNMLGNLSHISRCLTSYRFPRERRQTRHIFSQSSAVFSDPVPHRRRHLSDSKTSTVSKLGIDSATASARALIRCAHVPLDLQWAAHGAPARAPTMLPDSRSSRSRATRHRATSSRLRTSGRSGFQLSRSPAFMMPATPSPQHL